MAATSKHDLSSGSPDGPAYSNGHRSLYGSKIMERSGSFREASENRISASLSSMSKSVSALAQSDSRNIFQSLLSDLRPVVDQKFPKLLQIKRAITSALGISSEESPVTFSIKLVPSSMEELRRLKSYILESSMKARDRAQAFGEAAMKLDKSSHVTPKKRSRADVALGERSNVLSPGGSMPKTSQSLLIGSGSDSASQRLEERTKGFVPNRRIRSSMVEGRLDARANNAQRPSGLADRGKDAHKMVNGGMLVHEEKSRMLSSTVDGWEKPNMKRKRSVIKSDISSFSPKSLDGDRESRRQKFGNDSRSRMNSNIHGCRSVLGNGTGLLKQSDSVSKRPVMRPSPRIDHENSLVFGDRRDGRLGALDKEGSTQRTITKLNGREDSSAASTTPLTKLNPSARGPRSGSASQLKAAQNINRALASSDDVDLPPCTDKSNTVDTSTNRKRSISIQPAAPPAQWGEQRPQKISRTARRSTIPPFSSNSDELQASELVDTSPNDSGLAITRRLSSSQKVLNNEHVTSSALSESDDSGITENKPSSKIKKCSEIEEKACQSVPKGSVAMPSLKKTKLVADEQFGDGVRRQGRSGRGFVPARSSIPTGFDKPGSTTTIKQMRTARGLEKSESKPGRPPTKKFSERKGYTRPGHSLTNSCLDIAGELEDDHEELLTAANAATQTRNACSSSFWRQVEPIFSFISADDLAFLKREMNSNVSAECSNLKETDGQKGDLEYRSFTSAPGLQKKSDDTVVSISCNEHERDIQSTDQKNENEPFFEQLVQGIGSQTGFSVCQAVLSAIIDDEELDNFYSGANKVEEFLHDHTCDRSEMIPELQAKALNGEYWDNSHDLEETTSNSYDFRKNSYERNGDLLNAKLRNNNSSVEPYNVDMSFEHANYVPPSQIARSCTGCSEVPYGEMSIDDRILLELSEIGLCPEPVPDLAQSEDEDIEDSICALQEKLCVEAVEKTDKLLQIEKAVMEAKESQDRELEHIVMNKLVEFAYDKYMACCGPAAGGKNVNKITKHVAQAFIKRTLARCHKFEETGISGFNEQVFKDIFHSVPSQASDAECRELSTNSEPAAASSLTPIQHYDHNSSVAPFSSQRNGTQDDFSNALPMDFMSEVTCTKEESWSHKVKKRELLLDNVVAVASGSSLTGPSGIGNAFTINAKGKRSERERENKGQGRDAAYRSGNLKVDRAPAPNPKGERKNKSKLKQKTTNMSASVNGPVENHGLVSTSGPKPHGGSNEKASEQSGLPPTSGMEDFANVDLSSLEVDFGGQGQDIGSWLEIVDDDALQDHDFMGLNIPMDDLSEVNMML